MRAKLFPAKGDAQKEVNIGHPQILRGLRSTTCGRKARIPASLLDSFSYLVTCEQKKGNISIISGDHELR